MQKQFSSWRVSKLWDLWEKIAKWLIKICTVRMCCKCYLPILTLKGNICLLEMTIGCLMIALLPVHLCKRNGAAAQGERVHEAQTSDNLTLCPTGMWVAGMNVVLVSIGELLLSDDWPDCVVCSDRACSKGRRQTKYSSQCGVGLCTVPCNERYHTLKNYKLSPRYMIGQIAGQLITK